jgi:hypothetical protein
VPPPGRSPRGVWAAGSGLGDAPLAAAGVALLELGSEDLGEEGPVAEAVPDGGLGERAMLGSDGGQMQRPAGAVDGEARRLLGETRAHRAVPVESSAS